MTSEFIQVLRGRKVLASGTTDFSPSEPGTVYWVTWRVPRKVNRHLKFCVRSMDESENTSPRSCARLTIK